MALADGAFPAPAATEEIAGRAIALHYGDAAAEDRALHEGAALLDRTHRTRLSLAGPKAAEMLTGLVTNDVLGLLPGQGQYAATLTAKGKIVADVRIFAGVGAPDRLLVDTGARAGAGLLGTIRKFVNPRLAPYRDETATLATLGVYGPRGTELLGAVVGLETIAALPPYGHRATVVDGVEVTVVRSPELALAGWDLFVPAAQAAALAARLTSAGARPAGLLAWETARVEAGRPEWGLDMGEDTIPQEANFDELGAISYTKGCYTGQETVARVHFRGHVNKHLRQLRLEGDVLPPRAATLADETGKPVGDVRSSVRSPRMGAIAIGMVRREVAPGAPLLARWDGGEARATVVLPDYVAPAGA